ncbi:MAG: 50S ribosomal protein L29 [Pyrinomonadaceae bacterium MAG19_C2-C3]|nr:50S ribosomal protein L29 [Pyrinomonadaceae bacterium MAG19_C2-C3]
MAKRRDEMERLRDMSTEDLNDEVIRLKESLFRSRFKLSLGEMDAVKRVRNERRQVARIQTMVGERTRQEQTTS